MSRTSIFALLSLLLFSTMTIVPPAAAESPALDRHKASYTKMIEQIEAESLGNLMSYPDEYLNAINAMAQAFQQRGDLEGLQATMAERDRFSIARRISEKDVVKEPAALRKLQLHYRESVKRTELTRARKIVALTTRYIKTLQSMQKQLTVDGKITEALRVKSELKQAEESDTFINLKKMLAEEEKKKPRPDKKRKTDKRGTVKGGNVALSSRGAKARAPMDARQLNDGNTTKYDGKRGFAHGDWPCEFVIILPEVYSLKTIRFLLWDRNRRSYRYKVQVSPDGKTWQELMDRSSGRWRSWQELKFSARPVKEIKIIGLHNTDNRGFHIVEMEAYCKMPKKKVAPRWPSDKRGKRK